jgi:subfamily B ATP-binding cassette protein MsbA
MVKKHDRPREFFDRDYTKREAYSRILKYARPYRFRIIVGIVAGMLTAGTLVPLFQLVQPAVSQMEAAGRKFIEEDAAATTQAESPAEARKTDSAIVETLPPWFAKADRLAKKIGIDIVKDDGTMGGALLLIAVFVMPILALVRLGLKYLNGYCLSWSGAHAVRDLSCDMLKHVQRQSLQFFARTDVGRIMSRVTGDPREIRTIIHSVIAELAEAPFEILVASSYVVWFAVKNDMVPTLVIISVAFPLFMLPVKRLGQVISDWARTSLERSARVLSRVHEVLTCMRLVKSANTEEYENKLYRNANRTLVKTSMRAVRIGALVAPTLELVGICIICGFIAWCYTRKITLDRVLPMLAPLLVIYKPVKKLARLQVHVETAMASLNRIFSLLDTHMEIPEKPDPVRKVSFESAIEFKDVSFRYDTAEKDAVSRASFAIPKGKVVAMVGGTGSGKTTVSTLLARFADPTSGSVEIDGVDLRDIALDDLRGLVGVVTQEPMLFNDTIAYNISYGVPGATQEEIEAAAKLANAHGFIVSQPDGYGKICGEKGFALSGGERQRIAIARAILKNPPVLILDEATSALDTVTERQVQSALENLMKNRTTFVIAHRLSTIRNADMILVMDHGRIIERGSHDELYAQGGEYRKLCDMQKVKRGE